MAWQKGQVVHLRIFELFRNSSEHTLALLPVPWSELNEDALCNFEVFGAFANYMLNDYTQTTGASTGNYLSCATITGYLGSVLNQAKIRFLANSNEKTKLFFMYTASTRGSSAEEKWYQGIKQKIKRICFERCKVLGEEQDKSATPIYLETIQRMCAAYAKAGGREVRARPSRRGLPRAPHTETDSSPTRPLVGGDAQVRHQVPLAVCRPFE